MPELINQDTGLREIRFRRFDCLHLSETSNTEECSTTETITETTDQTKRTVIVDEQTPWITDNSRTIVNPTLQRNSLLNNIIVRAYLRYIDPNTQNQTDKLYIFEGSLREFEKNKDKTLYIKLKSKTISSLGRINASLYCVDEIDCKEATNLRIHKL